ncbi:hypothetical protein HYV50_04620 [Candidatus Pacearchaeota archaeon]|nr:hypothetical protein [Candidatus Pacearchaeota archaeon]
MKTKAPYILGLARIFLGLIFLWAFFDKLLGLGFTTTTENAWLNGISPTSGFLANATYGPFVGFYNSLAGQIWIDWLFMLGLLGIGLGLTLGILMQLSCWLGSLMMLLMWSALLPPEHHPFLDEHIIYTLFLLVIYYTEAENYLGFGKLWAKLRFIKKHKLLK